MPHQNHINITLIFVNICNYLFFFW